ncbi:cyclase family protein [Ideonella azotifigens]|uniref:Cyclase family protein n=1 Tax=Ideonella azotifigens TaxID=513160 RepID=A0ABP3VCB8_9BURK|nr:cyclase family protein [Ideonella azotifigens]MCD2342605.1 cyclase family protein [Ideonella azotifigens]
MTSMLPPLFMQPEVRLVDLSVPLGESEAESVPVVVEYLPHCCGGAHLAQLADIEQQQLEGGLAWASERIQAITHNSTHIDAPHHYSPLCQGRKSRTIDEIPLDWFWGQGKCLDISDDSEPLSREALLAAEQRAGIRIEAQDIVLFRTGAEAFHGAAGFNRRGRGLTGDVVRELTDRGVRLFGTDAWSIDASYPKMKERSLALGPQAVWEAHFVGREREFCAIEKLTNLATLPAAGFWVAAFPIKVQSGSAGWSRVVAFVAKPAPLG